MAFIQNEGSDYGCLPPKDYIKNGKIIYITLPKKQKEMNIISIIFLRDNDNFNINNLEVIDIAEYLDENQTVESYIVGHELAHAMSFIACIGDENKSKERDDYLSILEQIYLENTEINKNMLEFLFKDMGQPDDARNLLGLGKVDEQTPIISEFHYINEILKKDEEENLIRLPYDIKALFRLIGRDRLFAFKKLSLWNLSTQYDKMPSAEYEKFTYQLAKCGQLSKKTFQRWKNFLHNTVLENLSPDALEELKKYFGPTVDFTQNHETFIKFIRELFNSLKQYHSTQSGTGTPKVPHKKRDLETKNLLETLAE